MKAIIIGAGIGGAATAVSLRRAGLDVAVYEQAPEPHEVGAGIGLWGNAIGALRRLGLAEAVIGRGERLHLTEVRTAAGRVLTSANWADYERYGSDVFAVVHRAELLEELLRPLPDGLVHFGHTFQRFEDANGHVRAVFTNGHTDTADILIGADGVKSLVREQLQGPRPPRYSGYTCWRGVVDFPYDIVHAGYVGEIWGKGRRFGITRIGKGRIYWWATHNRPPMSNMSSPPDGRAGPDAAAKGEVVDLFRAFAEPVPSIIAATDPLHILRNDIIDRKPDRRWTLGRVLLIGDAAHATTPNLGQGGCMAIEDGVSLAQYLRDARPDAAEIAGRLAAFVTHRYRKTAAVVKQSYLCGAIGQWENGLMRAARDTIARLTARWSFASMISRFGRFDTE